MHEDTTGKCLPPSTGIEALVFIAKPDVSNLSCDISVFIDNILDAIYPLFSWSSSGFITKSYLIMFSYRKYVVHSILICPNRCICWLSMYSKHNIIPILFLMSSLHSLSCLTQAAFLRHLILHGINFLWCHCYSLSCLAIPAAFIKHLIFLKHLIVHDIYFLWCHCYIVCLAWLP